MDSITSAWVHLHLYQEIYWLTFTVTNKWWKWQISHEKACVKKHKKGISNLINKISGDTTCWNKNIDFAHVIITYVLYMHMFLYYEADSVF